jgi:hypothetical protein
MTSSTTTKSNLALEQANAVKRGAAIPAHIGHDEIHRASLASFRTQLPPARAALQDITSAVAAACTATNNGTTNTKIPLPLPPPPRQQQQQQVVPKMNELSHQVRSNNIQAQPAQPLPNVSKSSRISMINDDDDALFAALDDEQLLGVSGLKNGASARPPPIARPALDNDDDVFANIDVDLVAREYQSRRAANAATAASTVAFTTPSRAIVSSAMPISTSSASSASTPTSTAGFTRRTYYASLSIERLTEMRDKMSKLVDELIMSNVAARDENAEFVFISSAFFEFLESDKISPQGNCNWKFGRSARNSHGQDKWCFYATTTTTTTAATVSAATATAATAISTIHSTTTNRRQLFVFSCTCDDNSKSTVAAGSCCQ